MARKSVKRYARRYALGMGVPSGVVVLALAAWFDVPLLLVSFLLATGGVTFAMLLVGVTEAGIETASTGAEAGFMSGSDAMQYQPADIPVPDRLALVCILLGLGLVGLVALGILL